MARLEVDTFDGQRLALRGPTEVLSALPQVRWLKGRQAWVAPVTDPVVEALLRHELVPTPAGQTLLGAHLAVRAQAERNMAARAAFLEHGTVPVVQDYWFNPAYPPRGHQVVAFSSVRDAPFFGLIMEMGTGKSKVVVDLACDLHRRWGRQVRVLVVAPKTVCPNWLEEWGKHTTFDVNAEHLKGDKYARYLALKRLTHDTATPVVAAVTNYEGVRILEDVLVAYRPDVMACDEAIWLKNSSAKRTKACYKVGEAARRRLILTGLPLTKDVSDLFGQFQFLQPGCLGYTSASAFRSHYAQTDWYGHETEPKAEHLPELLGRVARFSFAVKRDQCLDLPPKIHERRNIEMTEEQARAYKQMAEALVVDLEQLGTDRVDLTAPPRDDRFATASVVIVQLLRLAQIASGFVKRDDGQLHRFDPSPKLDALEEFLGELDRDEKVVVWARFRDTIDHVVERCGGVALYGKMTDARRAENLRRWRQDPTCRLLVGQPQTGGFGINLVEARHVVYVSNDFSLQHRQQSEDRCHRLGQHRSVLYVDLVVPDTVDELVLDAVRQKRELSDQLTDRRRLVEVLRKQINKL